MGRKVDLRSQKQILIDEGWLYVRTDNKFQLWKRGEFYVYYDEKRDWVVHKYYGDPSLKCTNKGYN